MTKKYTPQDAANLAGLRAAGFTHADIAARTGIPRRSVSHILGRHPVSEIVTSTTRDQVSARLWEVVAAGTTEALRRIADPKTKAGELAQLIKVAAEQHALLTGGVTARTQSDVRTSTMPSLSAEDRSTVRLFLDRMSNLSDDEIRTWLLEGGGRLVGEIERAADLLAEGHSRDDALALLTEPDGSA